MCANALRKKPNLLHFVPYHLRIQEMYEAPVEKNPYLLKFVTDHLKTQDICEKAVKVKG